MSDTKKHKYKGKICAPPAATTAQVKSTKHWCKGKNGLEHIPVLLYNAKPGEHWGLATQAIEGCSRCKKVLRNSWDLPYPTYSFAAIVKAVLIARGRYSDYELLLHGIWDRKIGSAIEHMQDIADDLGIVMTIEFHEKPPKARHRYYGDGVRMKTRSGSEEG